MSTSSESISSQTDRISAVAKNIMSNFANKSLTLNSRDEAKKFFIYCGDFSVA